MALFACLFVSCIFFVMTYTFGRLWNASFHHIKLCIVRPCIVWCTVKIISGAAGENFLTKYRSLLPTMNRNDHEAHLNLLSKLWSARASSVSAIENMVKKISCTSKNFKNFDKRKKCDEKIYIWQNFSNFWRSLVNYYWNDNKKFQKKKFFMQPYNSVSSPLFKKFVHVQWLS